MTYVRGGCNRSLSVPLPLPVPLPLSQVKKSYGLAAYVARHIAAPVVRPPLLPLEAEV